MLISTEFVTLPDAPPPKEVFTQENLEELKKSEWIFGLPKSIKVLAKPFSVHVLLPGQEEEVDGLMKLDRQEVWVRLVHAKEQAQDTLLHEIIHAVDESLTIGLREKQVHQLAAALLGVFKDNPEFVAWILK
jgi:hypothetical protein